MQVLQVKSHSYPIVGIIVVEQAAVIAYLCHTPVLFASEGPALGELEDFFRPHFLCYLLDDDFVFRWDLHVILFCILLTDFVIF